MHAVSTVLSAAIQLGPLLVLGVLYGRRARTLSGTAQPVPGWRQACFYAGLLTILAALAGLGALSKELLALHMVEHLLIGDIAAVLIVLGLTGPLLAPVLRVPLFNRMRKLTNPSIALPLWVTDLYVWHLPVLYQAALRSNAVHAIEHVMFLVCGINLWMCLLGPLPQPSWFEGGRKALYVMGYWFAGTLLANAFIWAGVVFYPYYSSGDSAWGISQLTDQQLAGGIMMMEGTLVTLAIGTWLGMTALRESSERQDLVDFARSRGVALSSDRAARAVRAGRADELRRRVEDTAPAGPPALSGPQS